MILSTAYACVLQQMYVLAQIFQQSISIIVCELEITFVVDELCFAFRDQLCFFVRFSLHFARI